MTRTIIVIQLEMFSDLQNISFDRDRVFGVGLIWAVDWFLKA